MIKLELFLLCLILNDLFLTIIFSGFFIGYILYLISLLKSKLLFIRSNSVCTSISFLSFSICFIINSPFGIFSNFIFSFFIALIFCPSHFLISKLVKSLFLFPLKVNCSIKFCLISNLYSFCFFFTPSSFFIII